MSHFTDYGFVWDNIEVERIASIHDTKVLRIRVEGGADLEVYVSPKGRSVRVWKNHKEMK